MGNYNTCDKCFDTFIEDVCNYRIINGELIIMCDHCVKELLTSREIIELDKNNPNLTDEQRKDIFEFGTAYIYTKKGFEKQLDELNKELVSTQKRIDKLKKEMNNFDR